MLREHVARPRSSRTDMMGMADMGRSFRGTIWWQLRDGEFIPRRTKVLMRRRFIPWICPHQLQRSLDLLSRDRHEELVWPDN
jgi:hypothetical protein